MPTCMHTHRRRTIPLHVRARDSAAYFTTGECVLLLYPYPRQASSTFCRRRCRRRRRRCSGGRALATLTDERTNERTKDRSKFEDRSSNEQTTTDNVQRTTDHRLLHFHFHFQTPNSTRSQLRISNQSTSPEQLSLGPSRAYRIIQNHSLPLCPTNHSKSLVPNGSH